MHCLQNDQSNWNLGNAHFFTMHQHNSQSVREMLNGMKKYAISALPTETDPLAGGWHKTLCVVLSNLKQELYSQFIPAYIAREIIRVLLRIHSWRYKMLARRAIDHETSFITDFMKSSESNVLVLIHLWTDCLEICIDDFQVPTQSQNLN